MKWHSLYRVFPECPEPPFLLDGGGEDAAIRRLRSFGLDSKVISLLGCAGERETVEVVAGAIGMPQDVENWDAFWDLLQEFFVDPEKTVVVHISDAGQIAERDVRRFARMVVRFSRITESVERGGQGASQLEFVYWGSWGRVTGG
ncbi:barstar family protein [Lentzea rhizosphaerae]|jgi:hypothetical protein|uniref:Barstar family protein n=1 Tax=Lentzea rhizosphaerae TaxID=2041025 RepID=A0ABV8BHZ6_9PSEU